MTDDTTSKPGADASAEHTHGLPGGHAGAIGGSQECLLCPVCVFLQAMTQARPEVTEHLLAAARELTLALRAVVESQATAHERAAETAGRPGLGRDRFERINVD